jgi:hypothetical protein
MKGCISSVMLKKSVMALIVNSIQFRKMMKKIPALTNPLKEKTIEKLWSNASQED